MAYQRVIAGTKANKKQQVVVKKTGHPAVFRKMRCTKCSIGYMVQDNVTDIYKCQRCGSTVKVVAM
jgi:PHP family Zn ribbon phosphoesterase